MLYSLLDQLSRQCGIGDAYHNWRGDLMWESRETKTAILTAMGCPTDDAAAIESVLHERESARWSALLPPVAVLHPGRFDVTVAVVADELERTLDWCVSLEGGASSRRMGSKLERMTASGVSSTMMSTPVAISRAGCCGLRGR